MNDQTTAPAVRESEILQKLSPAACGWGRAEIETAVKTNPEVFLIRVMGRLTGLVSYNDPKTGEVRFGLKGDFLGVNAAGKEFTSGVCYLPAGAQAQLEAKAEDLSDGDVLEFSTDVYAIQAKNAAGYSFKCKVYHAERDDPFARLKTIGGNMPSLPAPATAQIAAPVVETPAAEPAKK